MKQKKAQTIEDLLNVFFRTIEVIRKHSRHHKRHSALHGAPSFAGLHALWFISQDGTVSMKKLADFLGITPPSATSLVEGLVKSDFLSRVDDPTDRRRIHLELSAKGAKVLAAGKRTMHDQMKKVLSRLSENDQRQLIAILTKLSENYA